MSVARVLRSRARSLVAAFRIGGRTRRGIGSRGRSAWLDLALATLFAAIGSTTLGSLFHRLAERGVPKEDATHVLAFFLTIALIGVASFDLHEAVARLVLDEDLELLRRAPIRFEAWLALKLLDAAPATAMLLAVLAGPALVAFAHAYSLPWLAWLAIPIALFALWAIPLGFGMGAALLVVRIAPASQARQALGLLTSLTLVALWISNAFVLPDLVRTPDVGKGTIVLTARVFSHVTAGLPSGWIAHALAGEDTWQGLGALALAGVALAFLYLIARLTLEETLSALASRPRRAARRAASAAEPAALARHTPASAFVAFLRRDLRLLRREWPTLSDVLVNAALFGILPLMPGLDGEDWQRGVLGAGVLLAVATGMGGEIGARLVPLERRGLAWVHLGPQPTRRWLLAKWVASLIIGAPLLLLIWAAATYGLQLPLGPSLLALAVGVLAMPCAAASGIWIGAAHGDVEWTNPRAMLRLAGRLMSLVAFVVQAVAIGILILVPASNGSLGQLGVAFALGIGLVAAWIWVARIGAHHAIDRLDFSE